MVVRALLYLTVGMAQDFLIGLYYLYLGRGSRWVAPVLGALITVLTVVVFSDLAYSRSILFLLLYGLGTGLGTHLSMSMFRRLDGHSARKT